MPVFLGLMFFIFLALGFVFFLFWLWLAWSVYRWLQKRKQQRAHRLATYLARLRPLVAELLHQINELDQASKYSGLDKDVKWSKKYGDALNKLLDANSRLDQINIALVEQQLPGAQEHVLYVIRTIHIVSYRIREMQPIEEIVELKAELKREQARQAEHVNHPEEARAANTGVGQNTPPGTSGQADASPTSIKLNTRQNPDEHKVLKLNNKDEEIFKKDSRDL